MSMIAPGPQTTWQGRIRIVTPILQIREVRPGLSDMAKPYAPFRTESSTWTWSPQQGSVPQAQCPHALLGLFGQTVARGVLRMPLPAGRVSSSRSQKEGQGKAKGWARLGVAAPWTDVDPSPEIPRGSGAGGRRRPSTRRSQGRHTRATLHLSFLLPVPCSPLLLPSPPRPKNTGRAHRLSVGPRVPRPCLLTPSEFAEVMLNCFCKPGRGRATLAPVRPEPTPARAPRVSRGHPGRWAGTHTSAYMLSHTLPHFVHTRPA